MGDKREESRALELPAVSPAAEGEAEGETGGAWGDAAPRHSPSPSHGGAVAPAVHRAVHRAALSAAMRASLPRDPVQTPFLGKGTTRMRSLEGTRDPLRSPPASAQVLRSGNTARPFPCRHTSAGS